MSLFTIQLAGHVFCHDTADDELHTTGFQPSADTQMSAFGSPLLCKCCPFCIMHGGMKEYKCSLEASEVVNTCNNLHCPTFGHRRYPVIETMDTEKCILKCINLIMLCKSCDSWTSLMLDN